MNKTASWFAQFSPIALLRTSHLTGAMLLVIFGGLFFMVLAQPKRPEPEPVGFHRLLQDYDLRFRAIGDGGIVAGYGQLESLSEDLDFLQGRTEGVENWLSLLKRRQGLVGLSGNSADYARKYRASALLALQTFPLSEPIATVVSAILFLQGPEDAATEAKLRRILPVLSGPEAVPARLALRALLGDLSSPEEALERIPPGEERALDFLLSPNRPAIWQERDSPLINLLLLGILRGDTEQAIAPIDTVISAGEPSAAFTRFAAEFFYDFGSLFRSAELFGMLPGEDAAGRRADALWLAGRPAQARSLWETIAESPLSGRQDVALRNRALFNLAVAAETKAEEWFWLQKLLNSSTPGDEFRRPALIRYSRLLESQAAIEFLRTQHSVEAEAEAEAWPWNSEEARAGIAESGGELPVQALFEVEVLRRRAERGEGGKAVADVWFLLNRHPDLEELYRWAAWYFGLSRNFTEIALLLETADRHGFSGEWLETYRALQAIREGRLDQAVTILASRPSGDWIAVANLARMSEARASSARALEQYRLALSLLLEGEVRPEDADAASTLQFRIARCLMTLGRNEESRQALELALEFNPDNLAARMELGSLLF
ncbi:MAG: hypothetical protein FWD94_05330 [Treponema sp.]|nr:hypothetical protein [Treponema sp.]